MSDSLIEVKIPETFKTAVDKVLNLMSPDSIEMRTEEGKDIKLRIDSSNMKIDFAINDSELTDTWKLSLNGEIYAKELPSAEETNILENGKIFNIYIPCECKSTDKLEVLIETEEFNFVVIKQPESLIIQGIICRYQKYMGKACYQNTKFSGDKLSMCKSIIVYNVNQSKAECFDRDEWREYIRKSPKLYIWKPNKPEEPQYGKPLKYAQIIKMPYSGIFVQTSRSLFTTFNTFKLVSIGKHLIGSSLGVSSIHGQLQELYKAVPIHRKDFRNFIDNKEPILATIEYMFVPEPEDSFIYIDDDSIVLLMINGDFVVRNMETGEKVSFG